MERKKPDLGDETEKQNLDGERSVTRRDLLKGFATLPVFGALYYNVRKKHSKADLRKQQILDELGLKDSAPAVVPRTTLKKSGQLVRIGLIGYGFRGDQVVRAAGFPHPEWVEERLELAQKTGRDVRLEALMEQEDLNIAITAVCDLFEVRAERAVITSKRDSLPGDKFPPLPAARIYRNYQDLLESDDVDAVIVTTPDHWHARIVIDAAKAGKHIYCEKCMTRTIEETFEAVDAVKKSGVAFQLGHQSFQSESHIKAREIIRKNLLGGITLIESTTNRNTPFAAWVWDIHPEANKENINWEQFQAPAPHKVPFSLERFFRWRCWYDYGTGISGDLLSHSFAAVNHIMGLGIPQSAVASGGLYYYKDGRDVPDVFNVALEFPDRNLTFLYSATLANGRKRGTVFMGHDASMEVGRNLTLTVDRQSTRYKEKIKQGIIDTSLPLFSYRPGSKGIDAITSATEKYYFEKGLMYTFKGGRRVDSTHLHLKDWLDAIRNGGQPKCNIDQGFEEAIACHMATLSYLEGRKVEWDPVRRRVI